MSDETELRNQLREQGFPEHLYERITGVSLRDWFTHDSLWIRYVGDGPANIPGWTLRREDQVERRGALLKFAEWVPIEKESEP